MENNTLNITPPRRYNLYLSFPSTYSVALIRHWPPVPAIFSYLKLNFPFSSFIILKSNTLKLTNLYPDNNPKNKCPASWTIICNMNAITPVIKNNIILVAEKSEELDEMMNYIHEKEE